MPARTWRGKVEQGIPEDDPRNAAVIAHNVGDCTGMAADLFESYAVTLVASLVLGTAAFGTAGLVFPLLIPMIGAVTAVIGILAVSPRDRDRSALTAINRGFFVSAVISAGLVVARCGAAWAVMISRASSSVRSRSRSRHRLWRGRSDDPASLSATAAGGPTDPGGPAPAGHAGGVTPACAGACRPGVADARDYPGRRP